MRTFWRILWHEFTCPGAWSGATISVHTDAGRIYDCGCGFYVMEAYR